MTKLRGGGQFGVEEKVTGGEEAKEVRDRVYKVSLWCGRRGPYVRGLSKWPEKAPWPQQVGQTTARSRGEGGEARSCEI